MIIGTKRLLVTDLEHIVDFFVMARSIEGRGSDGYRCGSAMGEESALGCQNTKSGGMEQKEGISYTLFGLSGWASCR